jgi:hypothetical protein
MALTSSRIALLAEAVRETSAVVQAAIDSRSLNSSELTLLSNDADLYEAARNSFVKYKGDGVDFDNARKREAIFYRVRQLLGLPFLTFDLSVELMELIELEVGQNFG